jgi:hypothetical protein
MNQYSLLEVCHFIGTVVFGDVVDETFDIGLRRTRVQFFEPKW